MMAANNHPTSGPIAAPTGYGTELEHLSEHQQYRIPDVHLGIGQNSHEEILQPLHQKGELHEAHDLVQGYRLCMQIE